MLGSSMPFEQGRTLLLQGRTLRRRKRWAAARDALSAALERFDQTEAPPWAQMAQTELARVGERPGNRFELTATEREVAELAATGLSNRQVAERAFLTVKAVEANLTRAYRKLGIRSRGGLARALERGADAPSSRNRPGTARAAALLAGFSPLLSAATGVASVAMLSRGSEHRVQRT